MTKIRTYVIVYPDHRVELYPNVQQQENFIKGTKSFSIAITKQESGAITIDGLREFIYTLQCPEDHAFFSSHIRKEW